MRKKTTQTNWKITEEGFDLVHPYQYRPWVNYLANGEYGMRISHLGDGYATTLEEPRRVITNYDFFTPNKGRFLFVKEGNNLWSPSFYPVKSKLDAYCCRHAPGYTRWTSRKNGVEVVSTVFLPRKGAFEIWKTTVRNLSRTPKKVSVFPEAEFHLYNNMSVDPVYYSWFTNSEYDEAKKTLGFFKTLDNDACYGFFASVKKPNSWETSLRRLCGDGDIQYPEAVLKGRLAQTISAGDPYVGCFQFDLNLKPGQEWSNAVFLGEGRKQLAAARRNFPDVKAVDAEFAAVAAMWKKRLHRDEFETVKNPVLRGYLQSFFPYQVYQQSEGLVRGTWRGYRDVAQDAMGLSYFSPAGARKLLQTLLGKQYRSGRCPRQWNTEGGPNDERDFHDLPLWLPLAVAKYYANSGDESVFSMKAPWIDDKTESTLAEHLDASMEYCLKYGAHGLLEMGKGDWNDALSGLGPKGESIWLNEFAYFGLAQMKKFRDEHGMKFRTDIEAHMEKLYRGAIGCWNGKWFTRGYGEAGYPVGGKDRIFLLPQAWFTISGMAERDPAKAKTALDNMVKKLRNDNGLLICNPGWAKFDAKSGNISALAPGLAENFAIYNHASAFGIYALLTAGREKEAVEFIKKVLPIYKNPDQTRAEPYVLVNFYNGGYYPCKAGEGGISWLTGTVHWMVMSFFDHVFPRKIDIE